MDIMSMVSSLLAAKAGGVQSDIAATILKSNADAERSAVLTILGEGQQNASLLAAGIGGNLDITA